MKKLWSVLLALVLVFSLAACSNQEKSSSETENKDKVEKTETEKKDETKKEEAADPEYIAGALTDLSKEEIMAAKDGRVLKLKKEGNENDVEYLFNPVLSKDFDTLVAEAKGKEVSFYGWGGDENLNNWLDNYYAPRLKEKYDITLKRVPMNIEDILSQLTGELEASGKMPANTDNASGIIDMVWINGENFATAAENGMLLDYYAWKAPNLEQYMDPESAKVNFDFAYPVMGREIPYGEAQLVMYGDSSVDPNFPKNTEEFMEFAKRNKGKVTYPALPDFTGSAFVRNIIYDIVGYEQFQTMEANKAVVKAAIQPALDYLVSLNPYLWNEGKTFPSSSTQMENMFADGELSFGMSYAAYGVAVKIENQKFKDTTQTFLFDKGMVGNTNYIAIPVNSPNKAAAIVAINEMISPEVQAARFKELRTLPVVDYDKLSDEQKKLFDEVELGKGVLPQNELLSKKLPEMPAKLVPIIEEIWLDEVVGK